MRRLMAALAALIAFPAFAAPEGVTEFKLDNGLQVVVIEDHRAPVVVQMLWYRAGAADEAPGVSGVAHFLEHLLFKATDNMASGELSRVVTENGGSDNAFTSQDYTAYFQRISADRLPLIMKMEADRMRNLRLTEEDIATERDVILEERAQRTDSEPGGLLYEQAHAAQYLNHPYGIPVIGWRHEMEKLDRNAALAFYKRFYAPNNATLVVAGDVQPKEVKELAETYYGPLKPTPDLAPRARIAEPPQLAERRLRLADARVSQPYLRRSYLAPERNPGDQKEAAALVYLAEILGGSGATSVLGRALQFDEPIAVYTDASYSGISLDDTSLTFMVVPNVDTSLREAEAALDRELAEFLKAGVDPAQLERLKFQTKAAEIYAQDSAHARADRYGRALSSGLTIEDVEAWPDVLQSITAEDVMGVARKVLDKRRSVTGWLVPENGEEM